ncbi:hypothetical protein [Anaerostipes hadrus]|jgi:hypothetical protein|nr:hypothetical protein [Anaerostipes hadrus]NSG70749.1 hypothetical protein [Anaerostipes hadrus]NSH12160.1 hypothetical protein [Anaerostipes hadrus]NSH20849.1 hypothetical protein [Anaerostipes hadrus]NSH28819.1 hypothetical protein [Anaerostipes hadrus]
MAISPSFIIVNLTITQIGEIVNTREIHTLIVYKSVDNVDNVDKNRKTMEISHLHRFYNCGKEQKKSTDLFINNCVQVCG